MKRILLGTMPVGGGHTALRDSLWTALAHPTWEGPAFELLRFDSQDTKVSGFYDFCIHQAPSLQRLLFGLSDTRSALPVSALFNPQLEAEARRALLDFRPDLVLSTHFLLSAMFVRARKRLGLRMPVVSAIPDYGEPTRLFAPPQRSLRMDALIAMEPRVKEQLLARGDYPSSRVHLSGFIPHAPFREMGRRLGDRPRLSFGERRALLEELCEAHPPCRHLDASRPTLLFLGGSAWTKKTLPVLERLLHTPALLKHLNVMVVCGRDEAFHDALKARVGGRPGWALFAFVRAELMARLMVLADVPVLGSLAPASMHELMETRCGPLMLFHRIPGSEDAHPGYIREQELGLYETDPDAMLSLVAQATALRPPGRELAHLLSVYPQRMRALRQANAERARRLGPFLTRLMEGAPRAALHAHEGREGPSSAPLSF